MPQNYTLTFVNNSANFASACVYTTVPNLNIQNVMSTAWLTELANPTTIVTFEWSIQYSFCWDETGTLQPGVIFNAAQMWDCDPTGPNQVALTDNGALTFQNLVTNPAAGSQGNLYINTDNTVPLNLASVGLAISNVPAFVSQAQPNQNYVFTPTPTYWITFGNYTQGQVLSVEQISNSQQVTFPPNVYAMTATLSQQNVWSVAPSN